jgi:hypothetical protein
MLTGEREFWRFVCLCVRLASLWKNAVVFTPHGWQYGALCVYVSSFQGY